MCPTGSKEPIPCVPAPRTSAQSHDRRVRSRGGSHHGYRLLRSWNPSAPSSCDVNARIALMIRLTSRQAALDKHDFADALGNPLDSSMTWEHAETPTALHWESR